VSDAAPYVSSFVLEYAYKRSLGPVLSKFFSGLKAGVLLGGRTQGGDLLVPPTEYDPRTGHDLAGLERVSGQGTLTSWTWVEQPQPQHPCDGPFAFGLIRLDGTQSDLLHVVLADQSDLQTGARVRLTWRPASERVGSMTDIAGFVLATED
jgi:hypothetical protein